MDRGIELFVRKYSNSPDATLERTIHPSDEMYTRWAVHPQAGPAKARLSYFRLGSELARTILQIANWRFEGKTDKIKVLEFACGHGRNVRHFVNCFPRDNIFVSDIYENAVQFNIEQFQVNGRVSVHDPEDLNWEERFDLIVVPSLFSHLPEATFAGWIRALFNLLTDDGILVFSVHGIQLLPEELQIPAEEIQVPKSGIVFREWSESKTLSPQEYGMSYVTDEFVRDQIEKATGRGVFSRTKRGFWNHQDFYIVPKSDRTRLETFKFDRGVLANIDEVGTDDHDNMRIVGWAWDTHPSAAGQQSVVVSLGWRTLFTSKTFNPKPEVGESWGEEFGDCGFTLEFPIPHRECRSESLLTIEIVSPFHCECIYAAPLAAHFPVPNPATTDANRTKSVMKSVRSAINATGATAALLLFWTIALLPVITRLRHPTLLGDDISRVVDVVRFPFYEHLYRPFSEHIAPFFQLLTSITWEAIGHDVRLAPFGFSAAAVTPWILLLLILWRWLEQETKSRTATLVAVAIVAQSPLVLESVYWYSSSSFLWAVMGVLMALWGASLLVNAPRRALSLIALGTALGPAGTTVGILAVPLAISRAILDPKISKWTKALASAAAICGFATYFTFCKIAGTKIVYATKPSDLPSLDFAGGLWYTITVPGRILWTSALGVPPSLTASALPLWLCCVMAALATVGSAALLFWPRPAWNRRLILLGLAMIYSTYFLTYASRTYMMKTGAWTEAQFVYELAGRYHVLPLLGLAAIVASFLASRKSVQNLEARRGVTALIGLCVGLLMFTVNAKEAARWNWMLEQPDQQMTLNAVHRLGTLAKQEGVTREQLMRVFDPVFRPWNGSLIHDRARAFHLMNLAIPAPDHVNHPIPDQEARSRLVARLTTPQRRLLGAGTCSSMRPADAHAGETPLVVAKLTKVNNLEEEAPAKFKYVSWPAYLEYEFAPTPDARILVLPNLHSNHDLVISWADKSGQWLPALNCRWLGSPAASPAGSAAIDLQRLLPYSDAPITRIRVELHEPGQLTLSDSPRLFR